MAVPRSAFVRVNSGKTRRYMHKESGEIFSRATYDKLTKTGTKEKGEWEEYQFRDPKLVDRLMNSVFRNDRVWTVGHGDLDHDAEVYSTDQGTGRKRYRTLQRPTFGRDYQRRGFTAEHLAAQFFKPGARFVLNVKR